MKLNDARVLHAIDNDISFGAKEALRNLEIGKFKFRGRQIALFRDPSSPQDKTFVDYDALEFHCKHYGYNLIGVAHMKAREWVYFLLIFTNDPEPVTRDAEQVTEGKS